MAHLTPMNAAQRAIQLRDRLEEKGYPFLGAEVVLETGSLTVWPLVQTWDDSLEALILIAVVEQDRQMVDAMEYARAVANQDVFGGITLCYALGHDAWISEVEITSPNLAHIMAVAL